jgi:MFS family permease
MIIPTIPVLTTYFGISAGAAAQTITAFAVGRFVGMPIGGVVLDRLGTRAALVCGPVAAGIAASLAASVPWFGVILVLVMVMGAGDSIWALGREVAGIDLARQDQRGRVLSGFHGIHNIGLALGPLLGGMLAEAVSFRAVFIAYAACAAVSVPLGFTAHNARPGRAPQLDSETVKGWGLAPLLQRLRGLAALFKQIQPHLRATYAVLVFATLTSFIHRVTLQSMLPLYASSYLGFTPTEVGLLFSISGVFVFAMILPAGFVIDKVGRKWATVPSTGIPALAFLFIPFSDTFLQLAVLVSLMGVANGLSLGSLATSTYDVVPPSTRGRLQAARRTAAEIGSVCAPLLGGVLADAFNPGVPFLAYAPLLVLSAVLLAVVGRETLER